MSHDPISLGRIEGIRPQQAAQAQAALQSIQLESAEEELQEWGDYAAFNPLAISRRFVPLEEKTRKDEGDKKKVNKEEKKIAEIKKIEEIADQYAKRNSELNARSLIALRNRLGKEDKKENILKEVRLSYKDESLADEVLDYLIETTSGDLQKEVTEAKEEFNQQFGREIRAGKNIATQAREFAAQGMGTPTSLRDLYREITGNPRDPATLFEYLAKSFSFDKLKIIIGFVLHALGSDLKASGPSISRAELHRLMTESRSLGAILGVYRFFKLRIKLIEKNFKRSGLSLPGKLTFELLARLFVRFLQERYPNSEKLLLLAKEMDIADEILAEIIVYTQMRDAVRQVAPRLFRSENHRQESLKILIEALTLLEDQLEEEEEDDDDDDHEEKE